MIVNGIRNEANTAMVEKDHSILMLLTEVKQAEEQVAIANQAYSDLQDYAPERPPPPVPPLTIQELPSFRNSFIR